MGANSEVLSDSFVFSYILLEILDQFRKQLLLGTEDGLYCVDLQKNEFVKITEKRVFAIEICQDANMEIFVIISGNRRTVRLLPSSCAQDGGHDLQPIKIEETKGASMFCINVIRTDF